MKNKGFTKIIVLLIITLIIGFVMGVQYQKWYYTDVCLDLGGGTNPGGYPICVLEQ